MEKIWIAKNAWNQYCQKYCHFK